MDGSVLWRTRTRSDEAVVSLTVTNASLYAVCDTRYGHPETRGQRLRKLSPWDGTMEWLFQPDTFTADTESRLTQPTAVVGRVYVGASDGRVYLLDSTHGEKRQQFETRNAVRTRPAADNEHVYTGSDEAVSTRSNHVDSDIPFRLMAGFCHVTQYDKLVRDRIPTIIEENGEQPTIHVASSTEYDRRLAEKLDEEVAEFHESGDPKELADVLEIVYTLADRADVSPDELERLRAEKAGKRGGSRTESCWNGSNKNDLRLQPRREWVRRVNGFVCRSRRTRSSFERISQPMKSSPKSEVMALSRSQPGSRTRITD
ncbi:PQQ-binding-like beta-propeller repeat protein [Haladaptatus sp. DFWS20]|uniref:outer membrane protein assembly factor BamB family protein n=1 Tax=Haladaptatus sp. DFWS20 TaxID=3403467 RepID=UPI003EBA7B97